MQALPGIGQEHTRKPTARRVIHRQAARTMAGESTQLRTVASIPARRIPITGTATTTTGEPATATEFTNRTEFTRTASGYQELCGCCLRASPMKIGRKCNPNTSASPQQGVDLASPQTNTEVKPQRDLPSWVYFLLVLVGVWGIIGAETGYWNLYRLLDDYGWIEHDHETPVWIKGEWLAGEYRVCQMPLLPGRRLPDSAHLLCGQGEGGNAKDKDAWSADFIGSVPDHEFWGLMAGKWSAVETHFHILPVNYWGEIDRSDRTMFSWRCQRNSDSLTCKALD